jgi:hypothetical protein
MFRHTRKEKRFALLTDIPGKDLGLPDERNLSEVNLNCDLLVDFSCFWDIIQM